MKRKIVIVLAVLLSLPVVVFGEDEPDSVSVKVSPGSMLVRDKSTVGSLTGRMGLSSYAKQPKKSWFQAMRYSGWTRFYMLYRNLDEHYNIAPTEGLTTPVNLTVGDGYQQPLMLLRLEANPSAKTWFQSELQFDHLFGRQTIRTNAEGRYANLYVIFQMQGGVDTRFGKFKLIAGGGANWYRLSPFTLWGYQYRDDLFERYPWDPEGHDFNRYNSYYSAGDIPRDQRFGMQATQGFVLEGTNMPAGFDAAILYGKTAFQRYQTWITKDPMNLFAGRIGKKVGDHKFGFSYFDQYGHYGNQVTYKVAKVEGTDTFYVDSNYVSYKVVTVDGRFDFKKLSIFTEIGGGGYLSGTYNEGLRDHAKAGVGNISRYKRNWDESLFIEISTKKSLTYVPIKLSAYRIGTNVVNNTSNVTNTSVEQAKPSPDTPDEYYINYMDGFIPELGQLTNNRQGINLFVNKDFFYNKIKAKLGLGMSQEIVNLAGDMRNGGRGYAVAGLGADSSTRVPFTNSITYEHKLNGLTRSRFSFYKRFQGPYQRQHSIFRRSFENVAITDSIINYKKSFNTMDLELKYKFRLFGKELIVSSFTDYSSVQDKFSPVPVFSDKAFLRYFYEELMAFYAIHSKVTLVGFFGYEQVLGNSRVEVADAAGNRITDSNGRPVANSEGKTLHQVGHGYGLGLDYNFHSRASLNIRHRWFDFRDKNFVLDRFKGNEMTVELKIFF